MPEQVGALMRRMQIGTDHGAMHDGPDRLAIAKATPRGTQTDKHLSGAARRSGLAQIAPERFADVPGQGQALNAPALAVDDQLPRPPVEVVQAQSGHLAGA